MQEFKRKVIVVGAGVEVRSLGTLLEGSYLRDIIAQSFMDTKPGELLEFRDFKKFCYRVMNAMGVRICLLRLAKRGSGSLESNEQWEHFFEELTCPMLIKVARFAVDCKHEMLNEDDQKKKLLEALKVFTRQSVREHEELRRLASAGHSEEAENWTKALRGPMLTCIESYVKVMLAVRDSSYFAGLPGLEWLTDTDSFERLRKEVL
jgi:hypothetical protein